MNDGKLYEVNILPAEKGDTLDYSVLEVFGDPSAEWGALKLSEAKLKERQPFFIIGHPMGKSQHISLERCVSGTPAISGGSLRHTCDTLPGNSGSPVIDVDTRMVVALHNRGVDKDSVNYAVPMSDILAESSILRGLLQRDVSPATLNPAPPATRGWVFLGRYLRNGTWVEPRSNEITGYTPEQVEGLELILSQGVNLQSGPFEVKSFADNKCRFEETGITGGLPAGSHARIIKVVRLPECRSYIWAQIE